MTGRATRLLTGATTLVSVALTAHTVVNLRALRRSPPDPATPTERLSVLLPARDEARQIAGTVRALLAAVDRCGGRAELVVLDDDSQDGTADLVRSVCGPDPRIRVVPGAPLPPGWLGKPWACHQLSELAHPASTVLVFVDADVLLAPTALAACVAQLRGSGLDLVSPYPRQVAVTPLERLVQPLLQWSWLTTLPLRLAERSRRPSLSAANGQLLCVDRAAYRRADGHRAGRGAVLDDVALVRAVKAAGGTGGVTDGTRLASCRMYRSGRELADGYGKSLWTAFGSPARSVTATGLLAVVYGWPAVAALAGSPVGLVGYLAGVTGRLLTGRRTGARTWPDALAHPASVAALAALTVRSASRHRTGRLAWKGRPLPSAPEPGRAR